MTRDQLAHILRAACRIVNDPEILVLGSQSILGTYCEDELPEEAFISVEADIAFLTDVAGRKADLVDGAIGELSDFHAAFDVYGQGVEVTTAILPDGWETRLVPFDLRAAEPAHAQCLDPHDLVVSKLAAHREKDLLFALALIDFGLIDPQLLRERAQLLPNPFGIQRQSVLRWINGVESRGPSTQ